MKKEINEYDPNLLYHMEDIISIHVGGGKTIKNGFFNWFGIVYCGMPNKYTFSLNYMETSGHQGYALNVYYPKRMSRIKIKNIEFNVLSVTPESIKIQKTNSLYNHL